MTVSTSRRSALVVALVVAAVGAVGGCSKPFVTLSSVAGTPVSWSVVSEDDGRSLWGPEVVSCDVLLPSQVQDPPAEQAYALLITDTETGEELWRRDLDQEPMMPGWPPWAGATFWVWDGERLREETDEDRTWAFVADGDTCD